MILSHRSVSALSPVAANSWSRRTKEQLLPSHQTHLLALEKQSEWWILTHFAGRVPRSIGGASDSRALFRYLRENSTLQIQESSPQLRVNNLNILISPENEDPPPKFQRTSVSNNFVGDLLLTEGTVLLVRDFQGRSEECKVSPGRFPQHQDHC